MSRPNLYLRGTTWWARVKLGGREHRRSLLTADPREAAKRLKAWRLKLEREAFGVEDAATYQDAVVRWAAEVLPGAVKPAVARRYLTSLKSLDPVFGALRVEQITSRTVAAYVSSRAGLVTNATIRRDLTALSRLLASCVAWGWLTGNPARDFDRSIIRERRDPVRPPSASDVETVLAACPAPMAAILRLLAATGMREMEAVQLERSDLNERRRQIRLTRTKTNRARTLDWSTPGGDATPLLDAAAETGLLFPNRDGGAYGNFASAFGAVMRRVVATEAEAKRPFRRWRVHDLRHGFATEWLKNGGDLYRLSRHLGHTSLTTTQIYLNSLTDEELDASRQGGGTNGGTARKRRGASRAKTPGSVGAG